MAQHKVLSDVSGKVCRLEAAVGATVSEGDDILMVESMKMEIPACSPAAGVLAELLVAEGDNVEEGQVVAIVNS